MIAFLVSASVAAAAPPVTTAEGAGSIASATGGATYFNRIGATLAVHDAELRDCLARVSGARISAAIETTGVVPALIGGAQDSHASSANIENCMVVKGWRVVRLPDAEGTALKAQGQPALAAQLAQWVGAAEPHGEVVRVWNNDAARYSTPKFKMAFFGHKSLSQQALPDGQKTADAGRPPRLPQREASSKPPKTLKPESWRSIPDGYALVLVHLAGMNMSTAQNLGLDRVSPNPELPAWAVDQKPDHVEMTPATAFTVSLPREGKLVAYALPAGRWRVASLTGKKIVLEFCLGAPAFDLKAGEVAYLGRFDAQSEDLGPDMDLAPARAALAGEPELLSKLKPVTYTNGVTSTCNGGLTYAYEVNGAPFEPGYTWGGAAKPGKRSW